MQAISDLLKFKRGSHESAMQEHFDVGAGPSSQQIADKRNAEYEAEQQRARDLKRYSRRLPDPMMADGNPFINMLDEPTGGYEDALRVGTEAGRGAELVAGEPDWDEQRTRLAELTDGLDLDEAEIDALDAFLRRRRRRYSDGPAM